MNISIRLLGHELFSRDFIFTALYQCLMSDISMYELVSVFNDSFTRNHLNAQKALI